MSGSLQHVRRGAAAIDRAARMLAEIPPRADDAREALRRFVRSVHGQFARNGINAVLVSEAERLERVASDLRRQARLGQVEYSRANEAKQTAMRARRAIASTGPRTKRDRVRDRRASALGEMLARVGL